MSKAQPAPADADSGTLMYPPAKWRTWVRQLLVMYAVSHLVMLGWLAAIGLPSFILIPIAVGGAALVGIMGWWLPVQTAATSEQLVVRYAVRRPRTAPLASLRSYRRTWLGDFLVTDTGQRIMIFRTGAPEFVGQLARRLPHLATAHG